MNSVLVGMFESQAQAASAHAQLVAAGFASSALSMTGGSSTAASGTTATDAAAPHEEGTIARFFSHLFGDDDNDAERAGHTSNYTKAFDRGSCGLTVTTRSDEETDRAEQILNEAGAIDVDEQSASSHADGIGQVSTATTASSATTGDVGASTKLQEVREELKVGKRAVSRGAVRVFTRLTETPVEESVTLREEHADIRRTAVDRPVTDADLSAFKEGSIEIRETAEEAVVSKTARVVGEVEVGKTATEREETIRENLRETKVEVEHVDATTGTSATTAGTAAKTATTLPKVS